MSNPEPLPVYIKLADGEEKKILGWACPECKVFHSAAVYACKAEDADAESKRAAIECCHRPCRECGCDMGNAPVWLCCSVCRAKHDEKRNNERIAKAKHVPWESYHQRGVYSEDLDEFYWDMDALDEDLFDAHTECRIDLDATVPVLWAIDVRPFALDAEKIVDAELEDHHEAARDDVTNKALARLQRMLDKWCKDIEVESFDCNYRTIVDMPASWVESLRKEVAEFREEMSE